MATKKNKKDTTHGTPSRTQQPPFAPFALLIDADNTSVEQFPVMLKQAETWGKLSLRRVYGNTETLLRPKWKDLCVRYALQPILHLETSGVKNATDIAIAVDALDLFHTQAIQRFCLVTGDQGYLPLILRLRSHGCEVYGIGKPSKTATLAHACTAFFPLADSIERVEEAGTKQAQATASAPQKTVQTSAKKATTTTQQQKQATEPVKQVPTKKATTTAQQKATPSTKGNTATKLPGDPDLTLLLRRAMGDIMRETQCEWVLTSRLGSHLKQLHAPFTAKRYGQKNLESLCKARADLLECRLKGSHLEVRLKL